ncbi:MAG: septation protein A [Pseudomonadota bacterium]|nr:septation protein A [Pseudomonadota bacterium]
MKIETNREPTGTARLLIDIGPLLIFFLVNFLAPVPSAIKIFVATGAFMAAMVAALVFAAIRYRYISPLLLFSGVMVVILGGLTIWLQNETFIKIKPTIYYALVAALLSFGLATGRPLLKLVLGSAYPGLDEEGWRKLTRNWAIFFAVMALVNEAVWRNSTTDFWIGFKLWGAIPATLLFAVANVPMLMRHGLSAEEQPKPVEPGPVE